MTIACHLAHSGEFSSVNGRAPEVLPFPCPVAARGAGPYRRSRRAADPHHGARTPAVFGEAHCRIPSRSGNSPFAPLARKVKGPHLPAPPPTSLPVFKPIRHGLRRRPGGCLSVPAW